eukprot:923691-Pyramimonas_sp.AAC.2
MTNGVSNAPTITPRRRQMAPRRQDAASTRRKAHNAPQDPRGTPGRARSCPTHPPFWTRIGARCRDYPALEVSNAQDADRGSQGSPRGIRDCKVAQDGSETAPKRPLNPPESNSRPMTAQRGPPNGRRQRKMAKGRPATAMDPPLHPTPHP